MTVLYQYFEGLKTIFVNLFSRSRNIQLYSRRNPYMYILKYSIQLPVVKSDFLYMSIVAGQIYLPNMEGLIDHF